MNHEQHGLQGASVVAADGGQAEGGHRAHVMQNKGQAGPAGSARLSLVEFVFVRTTSICADDASRMALAVLYDCCVYIVAGDSCLQARSGRRYAVSAFQWEGS